LKHRWEITQRKRKDYGGNQGPGSQNGSTDLVKWQWKKPDQSYSRLFHTAAVTYFAASLQTKSPNIWLFDSVLRTLHLSKIIFLNIVNST